MGCGSSVPENPGKPAPAAHKPPPARQPVATIALTDSSATHLKGTVIHATEPARSASPPRLMTPNSSLSGYQASAVQTHKVSNSVSFGSNYAAHVAGKRQYVAKYPYQARTQEDLCKLYYSEEESIAYIH